ncbi:MAG: GNAT family protein [Actinomycetota bacterium]
MQAPISLSTARTRVQILGFWRRRSTSSCGAELSSDVGARQARGDHVWVGPVSAQDVEPYRLAIEQSRRRLSRWNPVDPEDLGRALAAQSRDRRTFLIHSLNPEGSHDIVGKINVTDVVRGRFESAAVGYDAYDPYAGRGLFAEGLRLVLNLAFAPQAAGGMGLHRVAASVQPGNVRSAGLLRSLGFQWEGGFSPRMLWLPGADGSHGWRDHLSYVVRAEDWPADPYVAASTRRVVTLVNGMASSSKTALARQLAAELKVPLFLDDVIRGSQPGALWGLLQDSPPGGVVAGWFPPQDIQRVADGLDRCGLAPGATPEVWCYSAGEQSLTRPLGLGPTVAVDMGQDIGAADIVRIALQVQATGTFPAFET